MDDDALVEVGIGALERASQPQEEGRPAVGEQYVDVDQFMSGVRQKPRYAKPLCGSNHLMPRMIGDASALVQDAVDRRRTNASLDRDWLSKGMKFDAVVSHNDEMAIGAIQAMKSAGMDTKSAIVGGVDATQDALASMKAGDLKVTVFQDAAGQGRGAVDAALALASGKPVDKMVYIPFQLVTPANMDKFVTKN